MKKYNNVIITALIIILLLTSQFFINGSFATLKAGVSKVNITPPVGTWLSGYGSRDKPSDGISDDLYAKALVLSDGKTSIVLISTDLLWVPLEITNKIRNLIEEKTGIEGKNVLICGTHTHFGPKLDRPARAWPDTEDSQIDRCYVETLTKKISGAVFIANNAMQEVKIGTVKGNVPEILYNRRPKIGSGSVEMLFTVPEADALPQPVIKTDNTEGWNVTTVIPSANSDLTFGPVDPEVGILKVENMSGEFICSVVNFACHTLAGSTHKDWFYSLSADFPAVTAEVINKVENGICLFTLGTAGDMVPIKRGKDPRFQMGKALGGEVLRKLQFVHTSDDAVLNAYKTALILPLKRDADSENNTSKGKDNVITEIQILKIGDTYILGLPGEVLVEIGLEIKRQAQLKNLFIISLSNDAIGYVCHDAAYDEGGYEPTNGTTLARGAGEIMINEALKIIQKIKKGSQ